MSDEIRRLSDELARDPGSLVFLQLAEALRRHGQLDHALRIAARGVERHRDNADAHDLLARIAADRGELDRAFGAWEAVAHLSEAAHCDPDDSGVAAALRHVREARGSVREAGSGKREAAAFPLPASPLPLPAPSNDPRVLF